MVSSDTSEQLFRSRGTASISWRLSPVTRKAVLALHIAAAGGLVGATASVMIVAIKAAGLVSDDAHALYESGLTLAFALAIPFSFVSLLTGVLLGVGTSWGLLKYYWVVAKLALIVAVILMGALAVGPWLQQLADDTAPGLKKASLGDARWYLTLAGAVNLFFILAALGLGVFKPWGRIRKSNQTDTQPEVGESRLQPNRRGNDHDPR